MKKLALILTVGILTGLQQTSCSSGDDIDFSYSNKVFGDYWYQGQAEITSYHLEQARYGEIRDGDAVLVFVTEDFSEEKHVKLDNPKKVGDDAEKVLKLNLTKRFITGIYPYSMMTSVFTPVDQQYENPTIKITTTSQEWCGHTFTQMNRTKKGYKGKLYSYFESEGDQKFVLKDAIPEDELWNIIRLAPENLPTGKFNIIPGTIYQRISHCDYKVYEAKGTLKNSGTDKTVTYTVKYNDLDRTLSITFESTFPFKILSWEEKFKGLTTKARRNELLMIDYWNKNSKSDRSLRKKLGLDK